jgi:protease-4
MSFKTASAILKGNWLIEKAYAKSQLPLIFNMVKKGAEFSSESNHIPHVKKADRLPVKRSFKNTDADVYEVEPDDSMDRMPYNSIAIVDIIGPILKYGDVCSCGTVDYNELILNLASSDRVKGILLNIDSPGGQADGTGMLADTIKMVSKSKPIISVVQDGIAASAGIWIAAAAQEFYVTRATDQVGSIGAYCTIYDFSQFFEDEGIKVIDIYAPQSVDKNKDYLDALKGDDTLIKADLEFLVKDFISSISKSRGARLNQNGDEPFTGKMYNAKDALRLGLIDGIKPIGDVINRLQELINLRA